MESTVVLFNRFTTTYSAAEDRIRLVGQSGDGQTRELWFTQRILLRLVPSLLKWLENQVPESLPAASAIRSFAQLSARATLVAHTAVCAENGCTSWVVESTEISAVGRILRLNFKGRQAGDVAALRFGLHALRQWLNILHDAWIVAGWSGAIWPQWMCTDAAQELRKTDIH